MFIRHLQLLREFYDDWKDFDFCVLIFTWKSADCLNCLKRFYGHL